MDQNQSYDRRTVVTRGQAKKRQEEESLKSHNKKLKRSFQTGGQGISNLVDQPLGKIKIQNKITVKEEVNVEECQPNEHLENAFNNEFLNFGVTSEEENLFFEETHEQKVVVVSSEMDCEQDNIINLPGQTSSSQCHSNQNISVNLASSSSICGASSRDSLPTETLKEKVVFVSSDMDCDQDVIFNTIDQIIHHSKSSTSDCNNSNENTSVNLANLSSTCGVPNDNKHQQVTKDEMNVQRAVGADDGELDDHVENVVCEDMADVSPDESSVHCKCPCWNEIMKLKEVIQRMDQRIESLVQPSSTDVECGTHVESLKQGANETRCINLEDQNQEEISIKNVFTVKKRGTIEGKSPEKFDDELHENFDETNERLAENNEEEDSEGEEDWDYKKRMFLPIIHINNKLLDPDWLKTISKRSKFDTLIRKKDFFGYFRVMNRASLQSKRGFQTAMNAVTDLLEKIGPKLKEFSYEFHGKLSSSTNWYKPLLNWITLMPNLYYLKITCDENISKASKQELEKTVCRLQFPVLTRLTSLNISSVARSVLQSALIPNSKFIKKLVITDFHVDQRVACPRLVNMLVVFRENEINYQYFNNITAPLRQLDCCFGNLGEIRLNVITQAVEHFRNTLTALELNFECTTCKYEGPIKLCLPNLTNLKIYLRTNSNCTSSLFQGWTCEFFLSLVSQLTSLKEFSVKGCSVDNLQYTNRQNKVRSLVTSVSSRSDKSLWDSWEEELEKQLVPKLWIELPSLQKFEIRLVSIKKAIKRSDKLLKFLRPT